MWNFAYKSFRKRIPVAKLVCWDFKECYVNLTLARLKPEVELITIFETLVTLFKPKTHMYVS